MKNKKLFIISAIAALTILFGVASATNFISTNADSNETTYKVILSKDKNKGAANAVTEEGNTIQFALSGGSRDNTYYVLSMFYNKTAINSMLSMTMTILNDRPFIIQYGYEKDNLFASHEFSGATEYTFDFDGMRPNYFLLNPTSSYNISVESLEICYTCKDSHPNWREEFAMDPVFSTDGKTVEYGLYPQSAVTDSTTISALNSRSSNSANASGYYAYNGKLYYPYIPSGGSATWYNVEPINWRVLDNNDGDCFLLADKGLDALNYADAQSDLYEDSALRYYLNHDFFDKAFLLDSNYIMPTLYDNSAESSLSGASIYGCGNTFDYISLMSVADLKNTLYGFGSSLDSGDSNRSKVATDYSAAKGGFTSGITYWTRSNMPADENTATVMLPGGYYGSRNKTTSNSGIVPCIHINTSKEAVDDRLVIDSDSGYAYYGSYYQDVVENTALSTRIAAELNLTDYNSVNVGGIEYANRYFSNGQTYKTFGNGFEATSQKIYSFRSQPVKWRILNTFDNGDLLLASDSILYCMLFDDNYYNYDKSSIRDNCINDIFNEMFKDGCSYIKKTEVKNDLESALEPDAYYVIGNTYDTIFPLSAEELSTYYTTAADRVTKTSDYGQACGTPMDSSRNGKYWTRSNSGFSSGYAKVVDTDGTITTTNKDAYTGYVLGIRVNPDKELVAATNNNEIPNFSFDGKRVYYGIYPQNKENDTKVVAELKTKISRGDLTPDANGYYEYKGTTYFKMDSNNFFKVLPICWDIVSQDSSSITLLSTFILDMCDYCADGYTSWLGSTIRNKLNGEFYNATFTSNNKLLEFSFGEKVAIPDYNPYDSDYFIDLSDSSNQHLLACSATDYVKSLDGWNTGSNNYYWTKSLPSADGYLRKINVNGTCDSGFNSSSQVNGVRPLIKISIA